MVETRDGLPEAVPGAFPPNLAVGDGTGNGVTVDMGEGRFAPYAHMVPGSVAVKQGDTVQPGTFLGLLGNSGNSDAPHLHFQITDRPSALVANGLPFVYDRWFLEGRVVGTAAQLDEAEAAGLPLPFNSSGRGERVREMPVMFDVASFW